MKTRKLDIVDIRRLFTDELHLSFKEQNVGDLWFPCPIHGEEAYTTHPDAHINANPKDPYYGRFYCFGCGAKGTYHKLIRAYKKTASWKTVERIAKKYATGETVAYTPAPKTNKRPSELPTLYQSSEHRDQWNVRFLRYLEKRGITWDQIQQYEIGYVEAGKLANRIIVPVYLGKILKTYIARSILPSVSKRVLYPRNSPIGLFGSQFSNPRYPAIVCEGWVDALATGCTGYLNTFGLGTNRLHEEQLTFLSQFPYIIIVSDNDDGGRALIDGLSQYNDHYDIRIAPVEQFGKFKDAGQLLETGNLGLLESAIRNAKEWEPCHETFYVEIEL